MDRKLLRQALGKLLLGVLLTALLLFLPAGTLYWWNAWLLMAVLFIPMVIAGLVMFFKAPELLRRRRRQFLAWWRIAPALPRLSSLRCLRIWQ